MDTLTNTTESNNLIQLLKSRSFNVLKAGYQIPSLEKLKNNYMSVLSTSC